VQLYIMVLAQTWEGGCILMCRLSWLLGKKWVLAHLSKKVETFQVLLCLRLRWPTSHYTLTTRKPSCRWQTAH